MGGDNSVGGASTITMQSSERIIYVGAPILRKFKEMLLL